MEEKGEKYYKDGEDSLIEWRLFSKEKRFEKSAELFIKSANYFKLAKTGK
jgi:hypothetical protein